MYTWYYGIVWVWAFWILKKKTRENLSVIAHIEHNYKAGHVMSWKVRKKLCKLQKWNSLLQILQNFSVFQFLMITALLSTQPHSLFLNVFHCHCFTDRNECTEIPGICANGRCENTEGSFTCICQEGYKLNNERSFCISEEFISFFAKYLHLLDLVVPFYS